MARVALAYGLEPDQIESKVKDRLDADAYSNLPMTREEVSVGEGNLQGVAVGPVPGSTPSTEVYVAVDDERVYQINVYGRTLDAEGRELLSSLKFDPPSQPAESLGLLDATAPEAFTTHDEQHMEQEPVVLSRLVELERMVEREQEAVVAGRSARSVEEALERAGVAHTPEIKFEGACFRADSSFFVQTQHGRFANQRWGPEWTGWTIIGQPNYWGQFSHGALGFGRCDEPDFTNDMFGIDYPLDIGDVLFSPFKSGTVTFAGRNVTHADYGIFVTIEDDNGMYVSLSGHLSSLEDGIFAGARVTDETIIGRAGDTGGGVIPVGEPHLHQAFYRFPSFHADGAPFGGTGLQVMFHHFVGTAAGRGPGVYPLGWESSPTTWAKGDAISN